MATPEPEAGPPKAATDVRPQAERVPAETKFEEAMTRLEQIVHALEAGNLPLDESLRAFEEGTGLLRFCARRLEETERRIEVLTQEEGGGLKAQPFKWEEEPER